MDYVAILSVIYFLAFAFTLWRIKVPDVMIQTADEIDKMHSTIPVGEDLKHGQLTYLLAHIGSIRMSIWMVEKTLKIGLVGLIGAVLFSRFI